MSTATTKEKPKTKTAPKAKAPAKAKAKTAPAKSKAKIEFKTKAPEVGDRIFDVPLSKIQIDDGFNRRAESSYGDIEAFADVIQSEGQLVPVIGFQKPDGNWSLTAGHRRVAGFKVIAGRTKKDPIVMMMKGPEDTIGRLLVQFKENVREPNSDYDKAMIVDGLIKEGLKPKEIEQRLGISQSAISNLRKILEMDPSVQEDIKNKTISAGSALKVSRALKDKGEKLTKEIGKMKAKAEASGSAKVSDKHSQVDGVRTSQNIMKAAIKRLTAKKEKMKLDHNETFALVLFEALDARCSDKTLTALILSGGK